MAVGNLTTRPARTLVEIGAGQRWRSEEPLPGVSGLTAVSCPAARRCLAAERSATTAGVASPTDGHWTSLPLRSPRAQPIAALASVACPSEGSCVAVGGYQHGGGTGDLIETELGPLEDGHHPGQHGLRGDRRQLPDRPPLPGGDQQR